MVRLLILTGCRRSEISDLAWDEVDLGRAVIELPGSRTKNRLPHVIPLAPAAVAILAPAPRLSDHRASPTSRAGRGQSSGSTTSWGCRPWVVHDLRRSCATGWREHCGADPHLVELAINHAGGTRSGVAGVYDRSVRLAERRELLERWAALILTAAGEPARAPAGNVVRIGR